MNENFNAWIETLRTTDLSQAHGTLSTGIVTDQGITLGYCCLGVACTMTTLGEPYLRSREMLPAPVAEWLGLGGYWKGDGTCSAPREDQWQAFLQNDSDGVDIYLDIPLEIFTPSGRHIPTSCAEFNDHGFTFSQIADIITYFGVKSIG